MNLKQKELPNTVIMVELKDNELRGRKEWENDKEEEE